MKGEALMRKRHLEILGYRVVQVKREISSCMSDPLYWILLVASLMLYKTRTVKY